MKEKTRADQTRPDQTRPDQTRPDQTRPDQTRPSAVDPVIDRDRAERVSLARQLHQRIGSPLAWLRLRIEQVAERSAPDQAEELLGLAEVAGQLSTTARSLMFEAAPKAMWHDGGLNTGLSRLAAHYRRDRMMDVQVEVQGHLADLPASLSDKLFDIAAELLWNAYSHGGAKHCTVCLKKGKDGLRLAVTDDGCGFIPDEALESGRDRTGMGLYWIRYLASTYDGELRMKSAPGKGSSVEVIIPQGGLAGGAS